MAEDGMDVERIARLIKVSEDDVRKWIDENFCVVKYYHDKNSERLCLMQGLFQCFIEKKND